MSSGYGEACAEVLDILNHMPYEDLSRVSSKFIEFLEEKADSEYEVNLDYTKKIYEMDLSSETLAILGVIYRSYWCDESKKEAFDEKLTENERRYHESVREQYQPDNVFERELEKTSFSKIEDTAKKLSNNETGLMVIKKSIFANIFSKIINIFKKNKEE